MSDLVKKFKAGLDYLKKTGFDHIVLEVGVFGKEVYRYKPHSRFDSEKKDLPNPCQFRNFVLTKQFMDHYKIKTKVDIARYMRIVSIILTSFDLPEEYDNFEIHRKRLRLHLQDKAFDSIQSKRLAIRDALFAYDKAFSTIITMPLKPYEDFSDILNLFYNIYEPIKEIEFTKEEKKAHAEALKKGIELMKGLELKKKVPVGSEGDLFGDWDDYDDFETDDSTSVSYEEPDIMWAYDGLYKDFTDEKLVTRLKNDIQRGTLRVSLPQMGIREYSDTELKELLNNDSERRKFVQMIREWHKNTFKK
jgi:hypothetical protein